jgi:alanyl-tRNA synthetase
MTSAEIRQSFLDFFASKQHTIVPSASLMPTAPNLLFTNAGMNQFVPYFLGDRDAPYPRAADTQKCIRAGGKHNDLDDVGHDAYHQTMFEMLGNWSFGDYFKKEALAWSWELLTEVWKMPKERLYATVYKPGEGDPADFDDEAYAIWKEIFERAGLDPAKHIIYGGKKDNFWMMGDTGPCGPCSEIHMDLTPDNVGNLVNADSPWCIELWNNVFIQFNAREDGSFVPLKHKHVDTGMGFERVAGIAATTKNYTEFTQPPSNYNADLFTPFFDKIEALCGAKYTATLPQDAHAPTPEEMKDIVMRVLADHARCLCCAIADGILPGNEGRNYVLRRILRRAVMYGRRLNLKPGFFGELVEPVLQTLGPVFPELKAQETIVRKVIASEESAFDRTLEVGMAEFEKIAEDASGQIDGVSAFTLYDTYGFPLDLTQILAAERGLTVDTDGFEVEMEKQRQRARASQKKEVIAVAGDADGSATAFVGYEENNWRQCATTVTDVVSAEGRSFAILERSPLYAEMGGQVGDLGTLRVGETDFPIVNTTKDAAGRFLHELQGDVSGVSKGADATLTLDLPRRLQISRHHSATHILNWALRAVLGSHIRQAGSLVDPDRLRFDFNHFEALTAEQIEKVEALCNEKILSNDSITWYETPFDEKPDDVVANFTEKYGNVVRVVDIGGWSKELCGGTHVRATGEIGLMKITLESGIAAGTRRIEAVAGEAAQRLIDERFATIDRLAEIFSAKPADLVARVESLRTEQRSLETELKHLRSQLATAKAGEVLSNVHKVGELSVLTVSLQAPNPNELRSQAQAIFDKLENGLLVASGVFGEKVTLVAMASDAAIKSGHKAGDIIRQLTAELGGKGGGKPDFAMGGGTEIGKVDTTLAGWLERVKVEG